MLGVLPTEIILCILSYLPLQQLHRLYQVSRPWQRLIDTNEDSVFHNAAILHGFVQSQTQSFSSVSMPRYWTKDIHSWRQLCHKFYKVHLRWEGQESGCSSHVGTAGKAVWRFKIDEEQETVITTHFDGGLRVAPIESCGSDIIWLLPHSDVHQYAHVEFTNGFMVFTRPGNAIDVWRRKRDVRHISYRPPTLYNDHVQRRAQRSAWQSQLSISQDDRGAFVPWTVILPPNATHALRAVDSQLLIASQIAGEAYLYDLLTGKLIQSIQFRSREDPVVDVKYVELSQRHAFICTVNGVRIVPLNPHDASTSLRFPTDVEQFSEVFRRKTWCLGYVSGLPVYKAGMELDSPLMTPCTVVRKPSFQPAVWHCNAVHVSPCGSHFVIVDAGGNIYIVRDFEKALRGGTALRDNITIINVGYSISYLAYDSDHRIVVYVEDHGVFVLPYIINVTVPIRTCTMEPTTDMTILHVQQNIHSDFVQICSCLQLTKSGLWYSWTRMHTQPELGIANNIFRRIDFSQSPGRPLLQSRHIDLLPEPS